MRKPLSKMKNWRLTIDKSGLVQVPIELWRTILRGQNVRSKKIRIQRKVVKNTFTKALYAYIDNSHNQK